MTQKFSLWDDLSVRENLEFMGQVFGLATPRRRARVAAVAEEFDLRRFQAACRHAERRPAAATRAGGSDAARTRTAAARRAHQRGGSTEPPRLLGEPVRAGRPRRDDPGVDALHGRGRALPRTRDPREGRIVAQGAPQSLMSEIPAAVVEVEAADTSPPGARCCWTRRAQRRATRDAPARAARPRERRSAARTLRRLREAAVVSSTELVRASLEDVFVAATGFGRPHRPARAGRG